MNEKIGLLYCGSALSKNLYDKLLYLKTRPILLPSDTEMEYLDSLSLKALIITGSPSYVHDPNAEQVDQAIYNCGLPILGVCYGMQRMAVDLGGTVKRMAKPERETTPLELEAPLSNLYDNFADDIAPVWMVHVCKVTSLPEGFRVTGKTKDTPIASMENEARRLYGIQFHPEHRGKDISNQAGTAILHNFLRREVYGR